MLRGGLIALAAALLLSGCFGGQPPAAKVEPASTATPPPSDVPAATGATLALACRGCNESRPVAAPRLPDPLANGTYSFTTLEYDAKATLVQGGAFAPAYPARLHGEVTVPEAPGLAPLVVLLHGMHQTCSGPASVGASDACAQPVGDPVPSYQGYRYLAQNLASHGFVVVSIDADQANDRDAVGGFTVVRGVSQGTGPELRGDLVLNTLDMLRAANETGVDGLTALKGRLDMGRIGLMGHSRGGEGVSATIAQNAARSAPFALRAVFALAPTDFARHDVRGVPFATLLPSCDGDVSDLEGAMLYDDARAKDPAPLHAFLVRGADHNYYNTIWTFDDANGYKDDAVCDPKAPLRLGADEERTTGVALMGAFFRAYVGGELDLLPYLTGDAPMPAAFCGAKPCAGLLQVAYQPPADARTLVDNASGDGATNALGGQTRFEGFSAHNVCSPFFPSLTTMARGGAMLPTCPGAQVHAATMNNLTWSGHATWSTDLKGADWTGMRSLSMRVAVPAKADAPALAVRLVDSKGGSATISLANTTAALAPPESRQHAQTVLRSIRLPMAGFAGVDLASLARVEIVLDAPHGVLLMTDLAADK